MLKSMPLLLGPGQQKNLTFAPKVTRNYEVRTFGAADTLMVLFEDSNGQLRQIAADDDSGEDRNAYFKVKLFSHCKDVFGPQALRRARTKGDGCHAVVNPPSTFR